MKMTIQVRDSKRKMDPQELQEYLKLKRGNGQHKNKKAYDRKQEKRQLNYS